MFSLRTAGKKKNTRMVQYILVIWFVIRSMEKEYIYLTLMIFTMVIGLIIVWMAMVLIYLFLVNFIRERWKKDVRMAMENVLIKMENNTRALGLKILKLDWVKLNFQTKLFS